MDVWDILGIEPFSGIEEIRAAYSQKVKEFHPEDDPEGFMRVREAYKAAIRAVSGRPVGFTPPDPDCPAARPGMPPAGFNFSDTGGQKPARSGDTAPDFDFSGLGGQEPERTEIKTSKTDFDFSGLEQDAAAHLVKEKQFVDSFFAKAKDLYKSRKKINEWQTLLTEPKLEEMKRGEYFTWVLLDFLAVSPEIPAKVRAQVLDPFVAEQRAYWQGTPLWGEFDVAVQKYTSKGLEKASRIFRVQLACIALPVLLFVLMLWGVGRMMPADVNGARELLSSWYASELAILICLSAVIAAGVAAQVICFVRICAVVNRNVSGKIRISNSRFVLVMVMAVAVLFSSVVAYAIQEVSKYDADLRQIDKGRLSEDVVYVYRNIKTGDATDIIHVAAVQRASDSLYGDLTVPKELNFDPEPSELLDPNISREANLANGMKAYRVTYTDNLLMVVSIAEEP